MIYSKNGSLMGSTVVAGRNADSPVVVCAPLHTTRLSGKSPDEPGFDPVEATAVTVDGRCYKLDSDLHHQSKVTGCEVCFMVMAFELDGAKILKRGRFNGEVRNGRMRDQ